MPIAEVPTAYGARPEGSISKLRTYSDGLRILCTIVRLVKEERPLQFFALAGLNVGGWGGVGVAPRPVTDQPEPAIGRQISGWCPNWVRPRRDMHPNFSSVPPAATYMLPRSFSLRVAISITY
jgi:hypothetical protein